MAEEGEPSKSAYSGDFSPLLGLEEKIYVLSNVVDGWNGEEGPADSQLIITFNDGSTLIFDHPMRTPTEDSPTKLPTLYQYGSDTERASIGTTLTHKDGSRGEKGDNKKVSTVERYRERIITATKPAWMNP